MPRFSSQELFLLSLVRSGLWGGEPAYPEERHAGDPSWDFMPDWKAITEMSKAQTVVGPRPDVPGYADALSGEDREVLLLRPGITGPASLKYRDEEELLAQVAAEGMCGYMDPVKYNDEVIFPDKVRLNRYYLHHYSFLMDLKMIFATVLGRHLEYAGERI